MSVDWGSEVRRYALPVVLLLLAAAAALLLRGTGRADSPGVAPDRVKPKPRTTVAGAAVTHHVIGSGDTLGEIAARYETTVVRVRALNPDVEPTTLRVGQRLRVPVTRR